MYSIINNGLDFDDVLLHPLPNKTGISSRSQVELTVQYTFVNRKTKEEETLPPTIPIVAANMDKIGTFEVAKVLSQFKMITFLHKHYGVEDYKSNSNVYDPRYVGVSVGASDKDLRNLKEILEYNPEIKYICFDVANAYLEIAYDIQKQLSKLYPDKVIVSGNVVDGRGIENLRHSDIIKVGLGSGSVCTTRIKTGVGVPQLSAIFNCVNSIHNKYIMSDGGCRYPGDIVKAFVAGANYVMLGGMLAGHNETSKEFYGMSSQSALDQYHGINDYRTAEGRTVSLPDRGPLADTITDILGGIRSACTYLNCSSLEQLIDNQNIKFIRVSNQINGVFNDFTTKF